MQRLVIVTYHYIRDLPNTPFPKIKGLLTEEFRKQIDYLVSRYDMASWDSVLDFLHGDYIPKRDICYLTFDDGLKDHYMNVMPILLEKGVMGTFFPITTCLEESRVTSVHKNHFLMAKLEFNDLYRGFVNCISDLAPEAKLEADPKVVREMYPWDEPDVATYKYYVNHSLPAESERVLDILFQENFPDEHNFASNLYMNWSEVEELQRQGMSIGAHSHQHRAFSKLSPSDQVNDLQTCRDILLKHIPNLTNIAFCYPYGQLNSFMNQTPYLVQEAGFSAALTTMPGWNYPDTNRYLLNRLDTRNVCQL